MGRVVETERVRDSVRGLALGDAFGQAWFERPAAVVEAELAARRLPAAPWHWTDDTAMALALVTVLRAHGGVRRDLPGRAVPRLRTLHAPGARRDRRR
jgi:ADP-ribosylglycohydrolase